MNIKKRVLLLDDMITRRGNVIESRLETFAARLQSREGFACLARPPVDDRGFPLQDKTIEEMAVICRVWIEDFGAEGLVVDIHWWGDGTFGEKLWTTMKGKGLAMDSRCLVFLSQHAPPHVRASIANKHGLHPLQVNYKDTEGYDASAKWLVEHL